MATEKRLIWGDIAEEHLMKLAERYKGSFSGDAFLRAAQEIEEMPTVDAVEVVRCKDCRFILDRVDGTHGCYRHFMDDCNHDDFCSYGERRTDV